MLAVGCGIFGFGFIMTADVALTYLTDCYPDVSMLSRRRGAMYTDSR
jgi:hypothetical protein